MRQMRDASARLGPLVGGRGGEERKNAESIYIPTEVEEPYRLL